MSLDIFLPLKGPLSAEGSRELTEIVAEFALILQLGIERLESVFSRFNFGYLITP